jgi:hypothetical protein
LSAEGLFTANPSFVVDRAYLAMKYDIWSSAMATTCLEKQGFVMDAMTELNGNVGMLPKGSSKR